MEKVLSIENQSKLALLKNRLERHAEKRANEYLAINCQHLALILLVNEIIFTYLPASNRMSSLALMTIMFFSKPVETADAGSSFKLMPPLSRWAKVAIVMARILMIAWWGRAAYLALSQFIK